MHAQRRPSFRFAAAIVPFLLVVLAASADAQPSASVSFGGSLDSFAASGTAGEQRHNLLGTVNLEHLFDSERGRLFYDMDAGEYDSPGDWSFMTHRAGLTYRMGGDGAQARKVFFNGSVSVRSNGDAWTNAAYSAFGAGVNAETHPGQGTTLRAGYRADYRHFSDFSSLTQIEQRVFASVLSSARSRTTFIAEVQAGFKHYDGTITTVVESTAPTDAASSVHGLGRGMGPGIRTSVWPLYTTTSADEQGAAGLISGLGRVAQSLGDRTGANIQVQVRRTFGTAPPALVTTPAGFFEDGIYDDPFANDAVLAQAGVKHSFANGAELSLSGTWADKDYTGSVALNADGVALDGAPLRTDRLSTATASLSHPLFPGRTGAIAVDAELGYRFIHHRSNDAFYNYTSHAVIFGLTVGY